jgi:acetate kinase
MGLTPAGGLVMSTRSGDLDPGVLVHLMDHHGYGVRELDRMINTKAGLLGISGTTGDMQALLEASPRDERAALAVESFCVTARKSIGALAAVLGGIDTLVFMGGIGEHAPAVRARICEGLAHLGVRLDPEHNERAEASIGDGGSCQVLIVRTDEERMIARHTARLLP